MGTSASRRNKIEGVAFMGHLSIWTGKRVRTVSQTKSADTVSSHSRIFIHRRFDHSRRRLLAINERLKVFNRLGGKELLAGLHAHASRNMFDDNQLADML